jgi:hypothetical protein
MSIMRGGIMRGGIMRGGIMRGGIMLSQRHPIAALFARLGASGFWLDPLDHNQVWADTAGTLHPARGAAVARMDAMVHSPVAASFTNGTAAQQPILRADGLEFDGVDDRLVYPDDPALRFGTTDFTVAVALKPDTVTGLHGILSKRGTGGPGTNPGWGLRHQDSNIAVEYDYTGAGAGAGPAYNVASSSLSIGAWADAIVQLDRDAGQFTAFVNSVAQSPVAVTVGDISGTRDVVIGAEPTSTYFFDGTIGRVLAIDKLLSASDRAIVNDWLNAGHS